MVFHHATCYSVPDPHMTWGWQVEYTQRVNPLSHSGFSIVFHTAYCILYLFPTLNCTLKRTQTFRQLSVGEFIGTAELSIIVFKLFSDIQSLQFAPEILPAKHL